MAFFLFVIGSIIGIGVASCLVHPFVYIFAVMIGIVGIITFLGENDG